MTAYRYRAAWLDRLQLLHFVDLYPLCTRARDEDIAENIRAFTLLRRRRRP